MKLKNIAVFCGSSFGSDPQFVQNATQLGKTLAEQNITLIYGGAKVGLMGAIADCVLENGGKAIGIIPEFLTIKEVVHEQLSELIIVKSMHERKQEMVKLADGFISLPGGFGTLDELFECLTWAQLGIHNCPIGLLNVNGYFDHLEALLNEMVEKRFLKQENRDLLISSQTVEELLSQMNNFKANPKPKWI